MGQYSNSDATLVFSINDIKSLPKLLVGRIDPMASLTLMNKLVTSLYTIWFIGHHDLLGFLGHEVFHPCLLNIFHI